MAFVNENKWTVCILKGLVFDLQQFLKLKTFFNCLNLDHILVKQENALYLKL